MTGIRLGLTCLLLGASHAAQAADGLTPELVHDFEPGAFEDAEPVRGLRRVGDRLFFISGDREVSPRLWVSAGSPATTRPVPPPGELPHQAVALLAGLERVAIWSSTVGTDIGALWATDPDGRSLRLKARGVATADHGSLDEPIVRGRFYFAACAPSCSLWSTDGTPAGTRAESLADEISSRRPFLAALDDHRLVFLSTRGVSVFDAASGRADLALPVGPALIDLYGTEGNLYARVEQSAAGLVPRHELWSLLAGQRRARRFYRTDGPIDVQGWRRGRLYFADRRGDSWYWDYTALWSSDGTREGTTRLGGDLIPSTFGYLAGQLGSAGNHGLLAAYPYSYKWHSGGGGLYRVDDAQARVEKISDCWGGAPLTDYADSAIGSCGGRFFRADGTDLRFTPKLDGVRGDWIREMDGRLILNGRSRQGEQQIWETDGTLAGTHPLSGTNRDAALEASGPAVGLDGAVFVPASRVPLGQQLFRVGSGQATPMTGLAHLAKGIEAAWAGDSNGVPILLAHGEFQSIRNGVPERLPGYNFDCEFYRCSNPPLALGSQLLFALSGYLSRTNGTASGTTPFHLATEVADCQESLDEEGRLEIHGLARFGQQAIALDARGGLWTTDGTDGGTACRTRIQPTRGGWRSWSGDPVFSPSPSSEWIFVAFTTQPARGDARTEIWRTDGTAAGTTFLISLPKGWPNDPNPAILTVGELGYFIGADRLAVTDGTPDGTRPLVGGPSGLPVAIRVSLGRVFVELDSATGQALWVLDPASGAWSQLPPRGSVDLDPSRETGGWLYFFASPADSMSTPAPPVLWRTDGTVEGTRQVEGAPATDWSYKGLAEAAGRVLFRACDTRSGCELWSVGSDESSPRREAELWPGPRGSDPYFIGESADSLYFSAVDPDVGREVWVIRR